MVLRGCLVDTERRGLLESVTDHVWLSLAVEHLMTTRLLRLFGGQTKQPAPLLRWPSSFNDHTMATNFLISS